jgi:hypothetical protein
MAPLLGPAHSTLAVPHAPHFGHFRWMGCSDPGGIGEMRSITCSPFCMCAFPKRGGRHPSSIKPTPAPIRATGSRLNPITRPLSSMIEASVKASCFMLNIPLVRRTNGVRLGWFRSQRKKARHQSFCRNSVSGRTLHRITFVIVPPRHRRGFQCGPGRTIPMQPLVVTGVNFAARFRVAASQKHNWRGGVQVDSFLSDRVRLSIVRPDFAGKSILAGRSPQ